MDDDQSPARGDRVSQKIVWSAVDAVICRDSGLVGVGSHHVEGEFSLREKFGPPVDGKRRVGAGQNGDEMPFEGLYGSLGFVGTLGEGGN